MPIARLRGVVEEKGDDWVILSVGGIGVVASVPSTAADAVAPGDKASLFTHLHVREDALTLYGFATREDLALFELLIGVSGIGPRAALALLSALDYARLTRAIVGGQTDALRSVPGIGQKTAERLVLELRDKVTPPADDGAPPRPVVGVSKDEDVIAALVGLGYTHAEASAAAAPMNGDERPLEDRIRDALRMLAKA